MTDRTPVLVLGLGNVVCTDDGAGIAAIHKLIREYDLPEGVEALDGGTLGLSLLPLVDRADQVILLDAIRADGPPGTQVRIEGDEVAPAVYGNIYSVIGEWVPFDAAWLSRRIQRNWRRPLHRWRCRLARRRMLGPIDEDLTRLWQALASSP